MRILIVLLLASSALAGTLKSSNIVRVFLEEPPQNYEKPTQISSLRRERRSDAAQAQFPFIAELVIRFKSKTTTDACTGALISKDWIITALQCIRNVDTAEILQFMDVYLGDVVSDSTSELRQHAYAKYGAWIVPEDDWPNHVDIALFQLSTSFDKIEHISPVSLPTAVRDNKNADFSLIGWSYVDAEGTRTPDRVQYINLKVDLTSSACFMNGNYICATLSDLAFEADLGAPYVVFDNKGVGTLIGVHSGVTTSAVFGTDVSQFLSFINENV